jgi:hypothetical protein
MRMTMEGHGNTAMEGIIIVVVVVLVVVVIIIIIIIIIELRSCTYMLIGTTSELRSTVEGVLGTLFCWSFLPKRAMLHKYR